MDRAQTFNLEAVGSSPAPASKPHTMKKLLQELANTTSRGKRTLPDGSYVSERRLATIVRVSEIAEEIAPAEEDKLAKMVANWKEQFAPGTVKLYLDVCRQATKGKGYQWPSVKREDQEPTPIPTDIALRIIEDPLPGGFDEQWDEDLWTVCKLAINSCLRPIDAVNVTIDCVGEGEVIVKHRKTKKQVRSSLHPALTSWLIDREEQCGCVYTKEFKRLSELYRKRMIKPFLHRVLVHYGVSNKITIGMAAGTVRRQKLGDVIVAKSLRSTGANLLLSMGIPAHDVMAIGGWSSFEIFRKHYLKPNINVWNKQQP